jgi:hypothetical protein
MIDVRTAVKAAVSYLRDFDDFISAREIRLEEVELLDDGHWQITLSFLENVLNTNRLYKVFRVDAATGQVTSMKSLSMSF